MPPFMRALGLGAVLALAACTTPADVSKPLSAEDSDHNVKATVEATPTGFTVDVRYGRYQMFPEINAILVPCRSAVLARANEEAKTQGKEIVPIQEQDIRVSTGRNEISGRTSCRAFVEARWK